MQNVNLCKEVLENAIGVHETCEKCGMETQPLDVVAVQAMKELLQYRQIGTVEECREAVEKQTAIEPEKVNIPCTSWTKAHMRYRCSCGSFLTSYDDYCNKCGQKLKWG